MKNQYRIQNGKGEILCLVDSAQDAADIICNLGHVRCRTHMVINLIRPVAFAYVTFKHDSLIGFIGTPHRTYQKALAEIISPDDPQLKATQP